MPDLSAHPALYTYCPSALPSVETPQVLSLKWTGKPGVRAPEHNDNGPFSKASTFKNQTSTLFWWGGGTIPSKETGDYIEN